MNYREEFFNYVKKCTHLTWRVRELETLLAKHLTGVTNREECLEEYKEYSQRYSL